MLLSVNNVKSRKKTSENHKASYFQKCLKEHLNLYYVKKFAFNLVKLLASKKLLNFNRNVWVLKKKKVALVPKQQEGICGVERSESYQKKLCLDSVYLSAKLS